MLFDNNLSRFPVIAALLLSLLAAGVASATNSSDPTTLKKQALEDELHESDYWHALVHYYPTSRGASSTGVVAEFESHVDDSRFFLSESGKLDPKAELLATIDTLFGARYPSPDIDTQCRFVAREKWLRASLSLPDAQVPEVCVDYYKFRSNIGAGSVTLVFPSSFLNSPSSMFGHTLLRFDPEDIDEQSPLLSWSLNFAADVGDESLSAGYAIKGIAGGYPGRFSSIPYFEKLKEYGAIENRDIWEYKLDLTTTEIDRLLDHAWELQDISFDYFFFRQNCSFRLLELIDLGRPGLNLADQFPFTAIPAETVKAVSNAGIVTDVNYRPSQGTLLDHAIGNIQAKHRHWIQRVRTDPSLVDTNDFQMLNKPLQVKIIKTANDLLTFTSRARGNAQQSAKTRLELLTLISQLDDEEPVPVPLPDRPDFGHETTTLAITRGQEADSSYTEATLRLTYHDVLDRNKGYARGSGIELGRLRVRHTDNKGTRLESFDVVRLQSFSNRHALTNGRSWEMSAGLARNQLIEENSLAVRVDGSVGKSKRLNNTDIAYALLGGSLYQTIDPAQAFVNAHVRFGFLGYGRLGASQIELGFDSIQKRSLLTRLELTHNLPLSKNHALRFNASLERFNSESTEDVRLSYRFYF